jgi:predicted DNA-binding transcriptional regulator AlpA
MDLENDEALLGSKQVTARYDNICTLTLYRWVKHPKLNFPQPVKIHRRYFWKLGELRAWERRRAARAS